MRKTSKPKLKEEPLVVPGITDEDPMTSRRITRQPKKPNALARIAKAAKKR